MNSLVKGIWALSTSYIHFILTEMETSILENQICGYLMQM